ncbi:MAG: hypothetical protein HY866_10740, partial [Chloroflexi bacterium]|nr:hypothetical protein [Chloroflexota bacterium]
IVVQQLLDAAEELTPWRAYCADCPANLTGQHFGCVGTINYPISIRAERWLLDQLPDHEHPLVFMLLQRAIREMGYTGESAVVLRQQKSIFLQSESPLDCDLNGVLVNGNQVFEMLFMSGHVQPTHGALLLQFFGGISPDLDAGEMMQLADPPSAAWMDEHIPFRLATSRADDASVAALKSFFKALYSAYRLGVPLLLDV